MIFNKQTTYGKYLVYMANKSRLCRYVGKARDQIITHDQKIRGKEDQSKTRKKAKEKV